MNQDNVLPDFLRDYDSLSMHIDACLSPMDPSTSGEAFVKFAGKIFSLTEFGRNCDQFIYSQRSHDGGIDFTCQNVIKTTSLYCQVKKSLPSVEELASVVSKLQNYQSSSKPRSEQHKQLEYFSGSPTNSPPNELQDDWTFAIITMTKIKKNIIPKYENSSYESVKFFKNNKFIILDGNDIFDLLRSAYRKAYILPPEVTIQLETQPINKDNVFLGIISASEIKKLYQSFGDSIFLENIRDFLGSNSGRSDTRKRTGRTSVNEALFSTVEKEPEKMLQRNNGVTFRAKLVSIDNNNPSKLVLKNASIVNGCQTTMAIVNSQNETSCVQVKIVETDDSWDIAKSANFQNEVQQIELELARFIRPQTIKQAATRSGTGLSNPSNSESIIDILNEIYTYKITKEQVYHLFIGIFSKYPRNSLQLNYTELRNNLLEEFLSLNEQDCDKIFTFLVDLIKLAEDGRVKVNELRKRLAEDDETANLLKEFQRFYADPDSRYHTYMTIASACCSVRKNIYSDGVIKNISDLSEFFDSVKDVILNNKNHFINVYLESFRTVKSKVSSGEGNRSSETLIRDLNQIITNLNFSELYQSILENIAIDSAKSGL